MAQENFVKIFVNPLVFLQAEEAVPGYAGQLDEKSVMGYLSSPEVPSALLDITNRYRELSSEAKMLFAAPLEDRLLLKVVWPLRCALGSYMLGNYLGTIALCGFVAEMIATMAFEMAETRLGGKPLDEKGQEGIFGDTFERLRQERRTKILHTLGHVDDDLKSHFDMILTTRNKYLHIYSKEFSDLPTDAKEVFSAALRVVVKVIGQDVQDGKLKLSPQIIKYLDRA